MLFLRDLQESDWVGWPVLETLDENLLEDGVKVLVFDVILNVLHHVRHDCAQTRDPRAQDERHAKRWRSAQTPVDQSCVPKNIQCTPANLCVQLVAREGAD